jgi:hypothetical protein
MSTRRHAPVSAFLPSIAFCAGSTVLLPHAAPADGGPTVANSRALVSILRRRQIGPAFMAGESACP